MVLISDLSTKVTEHETDFLFVFQMKLLKGCVEDG